MKIQNYCTQNSITIGSHIRDALVAGDFAVVLLDYIVDLAQNGVHGAHELILTIASADGASMEAKRIYLNSLTECFGAWFLTMNLKAEIVRLESRSQPIRSPHARKLNKSCDALVCIDGQKIYVETKDFSVDFERDFQSGAQGYSPATNQSKRLWIEGKIKNSLNKGANILIARLSTWKPVGSSAPAEDFLVELLGQHNRLSVNHAEINVGFVVPKWFHAVYLIKRGVFVKVTIQDRPLFVANG